MSLLFCRQGAHVAAVDVDQQGLEDLGRRIGTESGSVETFRADITSQQDCQRTIQSVIEQHKALDILCNNAGTIRRATVMEVEEADWDRDMAVNVKSVYLWSRAVLPTMIRQGKGVILNTASGWGLTGGSQAVTYCASKGAVVQLTRAMAIDHGPQGIRVNCLCPGDTNTPMLEREARQVGKAPEQFLESAAARPLGRVGLPAEVAQAALYLVSDGASFVTGTTLVVDGGGLAGS